MDFIYAIERPFLIFAAFCSIVLMFRILTRTRLLQKHLRRWEYRYKEVVEKASDMILLLNDRGDIIEANPAAGRIFQLDSERVLLGKHFFSLINDFDGNPIAWKTFVSNLNATRYTLEDFLNSNRLMCGVKDVENENILDIVISQAEDTGKRIWSVFARDITEQMRFAEERNELTQQLNHNQRLESIGKLAGGVAHDFNNYLHAIQGHLDLIRYMHPVEDEDVVRHLDKIMEISDMASELTQQLLGFARKGKYKEIIFSVNEMLSDTIELFMPKNYEGLNFLFERGEEIGKIKGDYVQLQQVVLSILINSVYAMEDKKSGTKKLVLSSMMADQLDIPLAPPLDVDMTRKFYCIKVSDCGVGIDKEILARIFEPFFTTKRFGEGTGMGLSMAYGIALNHKGWIQVRSDVGVGTDVLIFIPCLTDDQSSLV